MALSKEHLTQLIALQERDNELDKLQAEINKIPLAVAAITGKLDGEKAAVNDIKTRIINLEKKKKEKELELASKDEAAKKHSLELNQVKTNEAFKALQNQIDLAKNDGNLIETDILQIMVDLDACRGEEKILQGELKGVEDKAKGEVAALEAHLKQVQTKYDNSKAVREEAAAPLPPEAMKIYNHVRSRGKANAVVPIEGGLCSACQITLTPQMIIEVTKAKSLVVCESCQRILYKTPSPVAASH